MALKATALFLVLTTLAGPFICCCTTAKAMSLVMVGLGYDPVACQSSECCHETAVAHEHSHAAKHHHHGHGHKQPVDHHLAGTKSHDDNKSQAPKQCPCRQDGNDPVALPATTDLAAKSVTAPLDFAWITVTLSD